MMQNRSFDHLFGTFPGVDGIRPGVLGYSQQTASGRSVSPFLQPDTALADLPHSRGDYVAMWNNGAMDGFARVSGQVAMSYYDESTPGMTKLWSLAREYALSDMYFPSVMGPGPTNQLMLVAASTNDNPHSIWPFYGPCNDSPAASAPYRFPHVGGQLSTANVTWGWFAENLYQCRSYVPQQNPFQYFEDGHDSPNVQDYDRFVAAVQSSTLPSVSFIQPAPRHTMHPGSDMVDGIDWLEGMIQMIRNSPYWQRTAIIVVWDEAGGFWDHVPPNQVDNQGHGVRVPLLVVSPHAKSGYISHQRIDTISILKFIQWNWRMGSLNARNQASADMFDLFNF